VFRILIKHQR